MWIWRWTRWKICINHYKVTSSFEEVCKMAAIVFKNQRVAEIKIFIY